MSGSKARASKERQELWLTATRSRLVATDVATGKVRTEVVTRPGETRIFDAETNRVTIIKDTSKTPPYAAATFEAALHLAYVQQGIMRVAGERTVNGRKALVLESVAGKWKSSDPGSRGDGARRRRDVRGLRDAVDPRRRAVQPDRREPASARSSPPTAPSPPSSPSASTHGAKVTRSGHCACATRASTLTRNRCG